MNSERWSKPALFMSALFSIALVSSFVSNDVLGLSPGVGIISLVLSMLGVAGSILIPVTWFRAPMMVLAYGFGGVFFGSIMPELGFTMQAYLFVYVAAFAVLSLPKVNSSWVWRSSVVVWPLFGAHLYALNVYDTDVVVAFSLLSMLHTFALLFCFKHIDGGKKTWSSRVVNAWVSGDGRRGGHTVSGVARMHAMYIDAIMVVELFFLFFRVFSA